MDHEKFISRGPGRPPKPNAKVADTNALLIEEVNETILALRDLRVRGMTMIRSLLKKVDTSSNIEHQIDAIGMLSTIMKNMGANVGTLKRATEKLPAQAPPSEDEASDVEKDLVAEYITK